MFSHAEESLEPRVQGLRATEWLRRSVQWEKGLSVPDAQMLADIAEVFNVSVRELLGSDIEQKKKEETKKKIFEIVGVILFIVFMIWAIGLTVIEIIFIRWQKNK